MSVTITSTSCNGRDPKEASMAKGTNKRHMEKGRNKNIINALHTL